jgi:cytochrome b6-f complex iron-sulfur subunit
VTSETEAKEAAEATTDEGSSDAPSDAWRTALATRRTQQHPDQGAPGAQASRIGSDVSRRAFVQGSFWTGLGITLLGFVGMMLDILYPRNVKGFGGPVPGGNVADFPVGGEPKHFITGQFWIVNLDPADSRPGGGGGGAGMLALWHRCPHLGCTVPWRAGFSFEGDSGWFRCPCHGSTYTKAGVRVFGPAPRSMDTMQLDIDAAGNITVQTGSRTPGGPDNPLRAGSA